MPISLPASWGLLNSKTGNPVFNVAGEYSWAVNGTRIEVPEIILTEYQMDVSSMMRSAQFWLGNVRKFLKDVNGDDGADLFDLENGDPNPYEAMYHAKKTGNIYHLPYFNTYDHMTTQNWGDNRGIIDNLAETVATMQKMFKPAAGIEAPYSWGGGMNASYTVTFDLLNTVTKEDIGRNYDFRKVFINNNLHQRLTSTVSIPPVVYEVSIPGVRHAPIAAITNLGVEGIGELNQLSSEAAAANGIKSSTAVIIPDAWRFNISFTELIKESRIIFSGATSSKINAITVSTASELGTAAIDEKNPETIENKFDGPAFDASGYS